MEEVADDGPWMGTCPSQHPIDAAHEDMMLDAVLSFLDDHDASYTFDGHTTSGSLTGSPSPTSSEAGDSGDHSDGSAGTPVPAKPEPTLVRMANPRVKRVPVRSDKRQREEMIALREESLELQEQLNELQHEMNETFTANSDRVPPAKKRTQTQETSSEESRKLRAEVWQAICETHQKRREAAEQERDRLRALIKEQKLAYRRLRRYLATLVEKSNASKTTIGELEHQKDAEIVEVDTTDEVNGVDFDELSRAIPTMFMQTSGVFMDTRLDSLTSQLRDLRVQNAERGKMSIEALESRLVPFDWTTTANAVWKHHVTKAYQRTPDKNESFEVNETCVRRTYAASITGITSEVSTARGRTEFRRYNETNRVVIIKSSIMDEITVDSIVVPQFAVREFQWTVIGPPRAEALRDSGDTMSQIETFRVGIPQVSVSEGVDEATLRLAMQRGCTQAISIQIEFERQSIENILLQTLTSSAGLRSDMVQPPQW